MHNKIDNINSQSYETVSPIIKADLTSLCNAIEEQKDTNKALQKQITGLKKDKAMMFYKIEQFEQRCEFLKDKLGFS